MQYSCEIFIKVKNPEDWTKLEDTPLYDAFYDGFFEEMIDDKNTELLDWETSMDEDELLEIAKAIKERLGKSAVMMAKTQNANVDPYYAIIGYCGAQIYSINVEEDSLFDEVQDSYRIVQDLGCDEVIKYIDLIEEIYYIYMIGSKSDFDTDREYLKDFIAYDKR